MNYITYKNIYSHKPKHIITKAIIHYNNKHMNTIALWDTGASYCHVTEDVIDAFDLIPIGNAKTLSHNGESVSKKYIVDIELPTSSIVKNVVVLYTPNIKYKQYDIGLIIGMDVIQYGDFYIDNTGERTIFTFRIPSDKNTIIETELF